MVRSIAMNDNFQQPPDIETASADYASRFSGSAGSYLLEVQESSIEAMLAPYPESSVIEFGGGHGQLLSLYQKHGMKVTIQGSDASCFARLPKDDYDIQLIVSDINRVPFSDDSFDIAVAVRLISHMDDWAATLAEMCRVARSAVIIDYPSKRSLNALTPILFPLKRSIEKNTRTYISFRRAELWKELDSHGFGHLTERKQLFLPMVVHRVLGGGRIPRALESLSRAFGLTGFMGSPVIMRAESTET